MARARACGRLLLRGAALVTVVAVLLGGMVGEARAQLRQNYYGSSCPSAESTVRSVISQRLQQSFAVGPGTLRLFFHDCFVRGCDASVMLMAPNGDDESHSGADATLSPDAVDAINKAKAAVEALPGCAGKVSCADILAMAARDVVSLLGGPNYAVELGRLDGKTFNRAIVKHVLPGPGFNLDQLNSLFAQNGLTQTDMIALSGAHTIGVTHCDKFVRRIYTFKQRLAWNPPMNLDFLRSLRRVCPINYSPTAFAMLDGVGSLGGPEGSSICSYPLTSIHRSFLNKLTAAPRACNRALSHILPTSVRPGGREGSPICSYPLTSSYCSFLKKNSQQRRQLAIALRCASCPPSPPCLLPVFSTRLAAAFSTRAASFAPPRHCYRMRWRAAALSQSCNRCLPATLRSRHC